MSSLVVNVVSAKNIPGEWLESSDPYVKLRYGGHNHKTRADKQGGRNPNFNQTFTFPLQDPPGLLEVAIYDSDAGFDDFLAKGVVELDRAFTSGTVKDVYPLKTKHGGNHGDIELEISTQ